ncbi:hypothetical protein FRC11_000238, partial [Ceratobasidium sp. 423]
MPAADSEDQQAARALELALKDAVKRLERPPVELEWFLALPKRIRRSGRLLEAAQSDARVLLDHARETWTKDRQREASREARLAELRSQPRNLDCLKAPDSSGSTWQGIGRRKRRSRKFEAIGRAFTVRQAMAPTTSVSPPPPGDVYDIHALKPTQAHLPKRLNTPDGLREAVWSDPQLRKAASRPTRAGYATPRRPPPALAPPPLPAPVPLPPVIIHRPPSPMPPPEPPLLTELEIHVGGQAMDSHLAYLMAMGAWESCKSAPPITLQQGGQRAVDMEYLQPGVLDCMVDLFYPEGLNNLSLARPKMSYIRDFVLGWTVRRHIQKAGILRWSGNRNDRNNGNPDNPDPNLDAILAQLDEMDVGEDEDDNGGGAL